LGDALDRHNFRIWTLGALELPVRDNHLGLACILGRAAHPWYLSFIQPSDIYPYTALSIVHLIVACLFGQVFVAGRPGLCLCINDRVIISIVSSRLRPMCSATSFFSPCVLLYGDRFSEQSAPVLTTSFLSNSKPLD